jgi:hypothetical protein
MNEYVPSYLPRADLMRWLNPVLLPPKAGSDQGSDTSGDNRAVAYPSMIAFFLLLFLPKGKTFVY